MRRSACTLVLCVAVFAGASRAAEPVPGAAAFSKPSEDVTLAFPRPGQVAKVLVKDGQAVRAGEVLARQDDAAEIVQLRQLEAQANNDTRVKAADAQLAQKRVDANKVEEAFRNGAVSDMENEHAKLDVVIAELTLELSKFEHEQDKLKHEEAKAQVERMRLVSPISGIVERVFVREGESRDAHQPVVRVVKTDPLHIDVPAAMPQAARLAIGETARVVFAGDANAAREGKIVHVASVADAASNTLLVRVEVPNPSLRKVGEHVVVQFVPPASTGPAATQPAATTGGGEAKTASQAKESR
jgi:RND family efflux transporter MFP subunit